VKLLAILHSLNDRGLLNLNSDYFQEFDLNKNFSRKEMIHLQSPRPGDKRKKKSNLFLIRGDDEKIIRLKYNVIYEYVSNNDCRRYIAAGRVEAIESGDCEDEPIYNIIWLEPDTHLVKEVTQFTENSNIINENVQKKKILLIGLEFDESFRLTKDSFLSLTEFMDKTNHLFEKNP
jgi:hypothetical protein